MKIQNFLKIILILVLVVGASGLIIDLTASVSQYETLLRRQHTQMELLMREYFNRAEHIATDISETARESNWQTWTPGQAHDVLKNTAGLPIRNIIIIDKNEIQKHTLVPTKTPNINLSNYKFAEKAKEGKPFAYVGPYNGPTTGLPTYAVVAPITNKYNQVDGFVIVSLDITHLKTTCETLLTDNTLSISVIDDNTGTTIFSCKKDVKTNMSMTLQHKMINRPITIVSGLDTKAIVQAWLVSTAYRTLFVATTFGLGFYFFCRKCRQRGVVCDSCPIRNHCDQPATCLFKHCPVYVQPTPLTNSEDTNQTAQGG